MALMETYSRSSISITPGQDLHIPVLDTYVSGTLWTPSSGNGETVGLVVVHSATATPRKFYSSFAQYLNTLGLVVVTYDYRGTGESGDPREFKAVRMRDWMSQDVPAVVSWAQAQFPGLCTYVVGHSLGGHAITLGYGLSGVKKAVVLASHLAYIKSIEDPTERRRVKAILNYVGPILGRLCGFVPGKKLGLGENITTAAMIEWSAWSKKPQYFFDDPTMKGKETSARVGVPILYAGATDDPWATPQQMVALAQYIDKDLTTYRSFSPFELGVKEVGHHGLVRRNVGEAAWPEIASWLLADHTASTM